MLEYKLIIFDCDGSLVDSESLSNKLISNMMNEVGINMTETQSLKLFKGTHFQLITEYVQKHKTIEFDYDFEKEFRTRCQLLFENDLKTIDGAIPFINKLEIPYCIASNGPQNKMKISLKVTGLDAFFTKMNTFSAYDIDSFKPKPDLFIYAAEKMGVESDKCLVIEDTVPGIEAALSAKMDVWGVLHPGVNDEIKTYGIKTFSSFKELEN
jgi:HAD superfamily hydrolase (TIGR01509 family)